MADITLPLPGENPNWATKLNTAILSINQDVTDLNDNLEDEVRDIAADVIASDPTIVLAAEDAVDDALENARIVQEHGIVVDLDDPPVISGILTANVNTLNTPREGVWTVFHQRVNMSDELGTQFALGVTASTRGELWARRFVSGVWTDWDRVLRAGDLGVMASVYREAGDWVWDDTGGTLATHYVLQDHEGHPVVRSSVFPTPAATPELDW